MQYRTLVQVNNGKVHLPGETIESTDKTEAKRLIAMGAIESLVEDTSDANDDAIEDLTQISLVTPEIAAALVASGVNSINALQKLTVEQLMAFRIKNVGKTTAEKILTEAINEFEQKED